MKDYFEEGRFFENHTLHQNHEIMKGSQQTSRSNQEYFSNCCECKSLTNATELLSQVLQVSNAKVVKMHSVD